MRDTAIAFLIFVLIALEQKRIYVETIGKYGKGES
jgi:hypothetical protein